MFRHLITATLIAASVTLTAPAARADTEPALLAPAINRLEAEGYAVTKTWRSWLGRLVIVSQNGTVLRETVLNRTTGAVLSDRLFALGDGAAGGGLDAAPDNAPHGGPGNGNGNPPSGGQPRQKSASPGGADNR